MDIIVTTMSAPTAHHPALQQLKTWRQQFEQFLNATY